MSQPVAGNPKPAVGRGYAIAIFGIAVWSATATFIAYLTSRYDFPPFLLAAWRDAIAGVTVWLVLRTVRPNLLRMPRSQWGFIFGYGLLLSGFNALWTVSVVLNGAAVSTVMVYSSAAFTALIAWRMFDEGMSLPKIAAVLLGIGGCVLVAGANNPVAWQSNLLGVVTGLISGLAFTAYSLMGKVAARRGISSWAALTYTFMLASVLLVAYNFLLPELGGVILGSPTLMPALDARGWVALLLLGLGPTIGGYGLYNYSLGFLPASVVNLLATMEPAMTAIQSYLLLGERFTLPQIIGSLLIIGGVVIIRLMEGRQHTETVNPAPV
ncbi:MAG TPA: EamA family transporter [Bellilinea sp.]|nr:EamA family transporter [Bellilinea sp.]